MSSVRSRYTAAMSRVRSIASILYALAALGVVQPSMAAELVVSAASSLTNAFREIGTAFEKAHPGDKVVFNFAASDVLLSQIARGAPADVFAAADQEAMDKAALYLGEIFHVGSGVKTLLGGLADEVLRKTGSKSTMKWGSFHTVAYDSDTWQADMTKTLAHFAWRPAHDISQGLAKTIAWYMSH